MSTVAYSYPGWFSPKQISYISSVVAKNWPNLLAIDNPDHMMISNEQDADGNQITVITVPDTITKAQVDAVANDITWQTWSPAPDPVYSKVVQLAQSAIGVTLDNLTAAQIKALVAIMLYEHSAIDPSTLTIRPLSAWVQ
jgi:hypothetical protein